MSWLERGWRRLLRRGLAPVLPGLLVGVGGAALHSHFLESLLFGVEPMDPATYGGVALALTVVATAACLVPAWAAARVDPMESLRAE